ncbi:type 1 fimbrial protein [Yokenella regensburgei]|uniref:fimbrial protein n=1 Tax=Yokenella regensburgei TaxID=158877 RepID=UPI003F191589
MIASLQSRAGCEFKPGNSVAINTLSLADVSIPLPHNAPPGTALGSKIAVPNGSTTITRCTPNADNYYYMMLALVSPGTETSIPKVYPTNLPGIGVKIWSEFRGTYELSDQLNTPTAWYETLSSTGVATDVARGIKSVYLQYYVTGPVTPGEVNLDTELVAWGNSYISTVAEGLTYARMTIKGKATFDYTGCETPNITVNLNKHKSQAFPTVGSTSASTAFNFTMNDCPKNLNSVSYTFKPAPGIYLAGTGTSRYLTLTADSGATGVGIQMLYNDETLVPFNTKIEYLDYVQATGGSYIIPMKARYIRTGTITGGTANSAVEFEMDYE